MRETITKVADILRARRRTVVMTGAGTSAESGIPTFREAQTGLWENFRPEQLATPEAFEDDPKRVWNWYAWRRELVVKAQPNAGHEAIAQLERAGRSVIVITQNVDGLHQRAGSQNVLELHGNILRNRCHATGRRVDGAVEGEPPNSPFAKNAFVRPDVVWFGEALPEETFADAVQASREAEVFFSIGTSSQVEPAASLARLAGSTGARIIEINPDATPLSAHADIVIRGKSAEVLPQILAAL